MTSTKRKKLNSRLGKCDVCKKTDAKYTCPRCDTVTCSLSCVKRHKTELDCDGVRVRTKYVPANKLNENVLLSDYRLLEEITRRAEYAEWGRETLENVERLDLVSQVSPSSPSNASEGSSVITEPVQTNQVVDQALLSSTSSNGEEMDSKKERKPRKNVAKTKLLMARTNRRCKQYNLKKPASGSVRNDENCKSPKTSSSNMECARAEQSMDSLSASVSSQISEQLAAGISDNCIVADKTECSDVVETNNASVSERIDEDVILPPEEISSAAPVPVTPLPENPSQYTKPEAKNRHAKTKNGKDMFNRAANSKYQTMQQLGRSALVFGIYVVPLPSTFEKHWENTSYYCPRGRCIFWHLKISFLHSDFYTLSLDECADTQTLEKIVKGCLHETNQHWRKQNGSNPLEVYSAVDFSKISVLMTAERLPNSDRKFYVLDMSKTLRENFVGKCIVEFPQLCVTIEDYYVVSKVQKSGVPCKNFFEDCDKDFNEYDEERNGNTENPNVWRKGAKKRPHMPDADRESGELTDSSDNVASSESDEESSSEELFKESEFRSIYKDLLSTFQSDADKAKKQNA